MSLLLALVFATATARVETVHLTTVDSRLAVRVALSGRPGMVAVHREGAGARVSIADAELGGQFAGGSHFAWTPADGFDPALLAAPIDLDRIEVMSTASEVSVLLRVPPDVSIDVRRDPRGLLLVFREEPALTESPKVARAAPRAPPATPPPSTEPSVEPPLPAEPTGPPATTVSTPIAAEAPPPPPADVEPEPATTVPFEEPIVAEASPPPPPPPPALPPPAAVESERAAVEPTPSADTAELARSLFPAAVGAAALSAEQRASVDELYSQLFPGGAPQTAAETVEPAAEPMGDTQGVPFGPFRVRAGLDVRYVDADTYIEGPDSLARDRYLEFIPRIAAEAPLADGRVAVEYMPAIRAFATYDDVNATSHRMSAGIDMPVGPSVILSVKDSFVSGVMDTRDADPGGEYFYRLGRFHRNTLDGGLSILINPRVSLELAAAASSLRFQEESSFFDYDSRMASAGLGYELTPTLKTTLAYAYDTVPTPDQRELAASKAHNALLTFTGDILPLVTGELTVGYRDQKTPNAADGGRRYQGFTMGGSLTKQFSRESNLTLFVNRSTPVSAFEENAFYVFTIVQGAARLPLPLEFQLQGGLGYQWNDYRTVSIEIGAPREDRILGYYVGLRRALLRQLFLSAAFRREERTSNIERFNTDSDGFIFQLEWDIFGNTP